MTKLIYVLCWLCLYSLLTIIAFGVEAADTAVGQLSNMTILEGDTGLIVVDTLLSVETAKAALDLYYQLLFASGFTTSRAQSTNSFATGLRSRFFSVTRPIGLRVSGKSMGSAFSDPR